MSFPGNDPFFETMLNVLGSSYGGSTGANAINLLQALNNGDTQNVIDNLSNNGYALFSLGNVMGATSDEESDIQNQSLQNSEEFKRDPSIILYEKSKWFSSIKNSIPERDNNDVCSICYDVIKDDHACVSLNSCKHTFHTSCLDEWVKYNKGKCPECRKYIYSSITYDMEKRQVKEGFEHLEEFAEKLTDKDLRTNITYDYLTDDDENNDDKKTFCKTYTKTKKVDGLYIKDKPMSEPTPRETKNQESSVDSDNRSDSDSTSSGLLDDAMYQSHLSQSEEHDARIELYNIVKKQYQDRAELKKKIICELDMKILKLTKNHMDNIKSHQEKILETIRNIEE